MAASPLVALTIWAALTLYVVGRGRPRATAASALGPPGLAARGALVYLGHVAAAFGVHHDWSHAAAYAYTAARTEAYFGLDWGGGLWVNYAFTVIWVAEGLWWRFAPTFATRGARPSLRSVVRERLPVHDHQRRGGLRGRAAAC